ncbi:MAG: hypothetical protein ACE37K_05525 [Planctomycetota bacterium]
MTVRSVLLPLLFVPSLLAQEAKPEAAAEAEAPRRPFTRLIENDQGGRLEILIATYRKGDAELTLFGCVHVADREFYEGMQKRFRGLDALLYELIGDPDVRPYPGMEVGDDEHWISMVQGGMGAGLKLADQFGSMDYRMDNFVHADMTEQEWMDALAVAGKSELGEMLSLGSPDVDREAEANKKEIDLVGAFRSGGGIAELRIVMARSLLGGDPAIDQPTVIIHGRNEKCLRVLQDQLDLGKKKLGIFYGAAHMEHMEHRLMQDMGWQRVKEQWVLAWDCSYQKWPKQERGLKQKRYRARRDLKKLLKAVQAFAAGHAGEVTWAALRESRKDGKLPGRNDGKDSWGRHYLLRRYGDDFQVRCLGSDGKPDTADDLFEGVDSPVGGVLKELNRRRKGDDGDLVLPRAEGQGQPTGAVKKAGRAKN